MDFFDILPFVDRNKRGFQWSVHRWDDEYIMRGRVVTELPQLEHAVNISTPVASSRSGPYYKITMGVVYLDIPTMFAMYTEQSLLDLHRRLESFVENMQNDPVVLRSLDRGH
jgi:hypothetical protein